MQYCTAGRVKTLPYSTISVVCDKLEFERKVDTERVREVTNTDQPISHWVRRLAAKLEFMCH